MEKELTKYALFNKAEDAFVSDEFPTYLLYCWGDEEPMIWDTFEEVKGLCEYFDNLPLEIYEVKQIITSKISKTPIIVK